MKKNKPISKILLQESAFDLVILGGGITGANAFWDATLRGLKVLLLEKNDFSSGTTQATSKLIHGGLRYLKNLEFGLVRESLAERRILAKISPHGMQTLGFLAPIYDWKKRLLLKAGMELYNVLSYDRNQEIGKDWYIPRYKFLSKSELYYQIPGLERTDLQGGFLYYDYANLNPERHSFEFISSGQSRGGVALSYSEAIQISLGAKQIYEILYRDRLKNQDGVVLAKSVLNCAGPWADALESLVGVPQETKLLRSKGIHVVVRGLKTPYTLLLQKRDGSHLFVIPWRDRTILGTTDTQFLEDPDKVAITRKEIEDLLLDVNHSFGLQPLHLEDVVYFYGGLRPLIQEPGDNSSTYTASRKSEVVSHKEHGFPGFFSALGGKYTTSRAVAENALDLVSEFLPGKFAPCQTKSEPTLGGKFADFPSLHQDLRKQFPKVSGEKLEMLARRYGSLVFQMAPQPDQSTQAYPLANGEKFYEEEILFLAIHESIKTASDFFFRRSGVGTVGLPICYKEIIEFLGKILKWDQKRKESETKQILARYAIQV